MSRRPVLLVGIGDLGDRLAERLIRERVVSDLLLASRSGERGAEIARVAAGTCPSVRFRRLDALDQAAVEALLVAEEPRLVIHCASLLSPWELADRKDGAAEALRTAGFALQLPAQLPLIETVMRAARAVGYSSPVINCSYPDLTNMVLAKFGLAPSVGIGNVSMIESRVRSLVDPDGSRMAVVRVLAHHAQVDASLSALQDAKRPNPSPRVYLGERGERADELAYAAPPIAGASRRNALTAAVAVPVIRAFLSGGTLRTCVPGPNGLAGGYPAVVDGGAVALDLPDSLSAAAAVQFQLHSARLDGVEYVAADGTVHFTAAAARAVEEVDGALAAPLRPGEALARLRRIISALGTRERGA
jgi:hypothetical protein